MKSKILLSTLLLLTFNSSIPVENADIDTLYDMRWMELTPDQHKLIENTYTSSPLYTLITACKQDDIAKVRELIASKIVNVNLQVPRSQGGETALCIAAYHGNFELVKVLIEEGKADVNLPSRSFSQSPLMYAADNSWRKLYTIGKGEDYPSVVRFLINAGASVDQYDCLGYRALRYAQSSRDSSRNDKMRTIEEEIISILEIRGALQEYNRQQSRN